MSFRSSLANSVFRGIGAGASPSATKPKPKDGDMTQEEKDRRARNKKAGRAEDDDGETDAQRAERETAEAAQADTDRRQRNKAAGREEDDDGDDDDDEKKKGEEDDEDEDDMRKDSKSRAVRLRERARCAAIFGHSAARGREEAAANLAFNTNTPRHQAGALLASMPTAAPPPPVAGLHARQQGQENRSAGAGGAPLTGQAKAVAEADEIWKRVAISPNAKRN